MDSSHSSRGLAQPLWPAQAPRMFATILITAGATSFGGQAASVAADDGACWYSQYGCVACHGGRGEGTPIAPALVGRPDNPLSYEAIASRVRTPVAPMPQYPREVLADDHLQAIAAWIWSQEPAR